MCSEMYVTVINSSKLFVVLDLLSYISYCVLQCTKIWCTCRALMCELVKISWCAVWLCWLGYHLVCTLLWMMSQFIFFFAKCSKCFLYSGIPWRDSLYDPMVWTANHLWCPRSPESCWEYFWKQGSSDGKYAYLF